MRIQFHNAVTNVSCDCVDGPCGFTHWKALRESRAYWCRVRIPCSLGVWVWKRGMEQRREGDAIH